MDDTARDVAASPLPERVPAVAARHAGQGAGHSADPGALPGDTPPASATGLSPVPARLHALGTEPFWSIDVDGDTLVYATPEVERGVRITITRRAGPEGTVIAGTVDGKPLTLTVAAGPCGDGMSDRVYAYTVTRQLGPDIARGCADRR